MAFLHFTDHLHLMLQKGSEFGPIVIQPLEIDLHVFNLLALYAFQVVLAHLSVDIEDFV